MEGPDVAARPWNLRDEQIAKVYEKYIIALKDSNALDFDDLLLKTVELFETSEPAREFYSQKFQLRHGGRVPGHQPAAVPADPPPRRGPPQPRRRRRSRPVDLQVARRRPAQHPRLRARLRRRADRPARTELPLDADDPRRRVRGDQPEPQPQGQAAVDGPQGRLADLLLPRQRRARGSGLHRPDGEAARRPKTSTRRWRCSTAPTRSRARSKTR